MNEPDLQFITSPSLKSWKRRTEFAVLSLFTTVITAVYFFTQALWSDASVRWDGANYVSMAEQIAAHKIPTADAPFVYRLGFPALAALLNPQNPSSAMRLISIASGVAAVFLLWWWLTRFPISSLIRLGLVGIFALQYHGPLRFGIFFPTLTYSLFWVFLLGGLLVLHSMLTSEESTILSLIAVAVLCFLGALVRETMLIAPIAMLLFRPQMRKSSRLTFIKVMTCAFGGCVIGIVCSHKFSVATGTYSFSKTAESLLDQKTLLELAAALFLSFGPLLAVFVASPARSLQLFEKYRELSALLFVSIALAVIGGSNTEMFMFWASPAVFVVMGIILSEDLMRSRHRHFIGVLFAAQLMSERVFLNIPLPLESNHVPFVIFSPLGGTSYMQLWSNFAATSILTRIVFTNCLFIFFYAMSFWWTQRQKEDDESELATFDAMVSN